MEFQLQVNANATKVLSCTKKGDCMSVILIRLNCLIDLSAWKLKPISTSFAENPESLAFGAVVTISLRARSRLGSCSTGHRQRAAGQMRILCPGGKDGCCACLGVLVVCHARTNANHMFVYIQTGSFLGFQKLIQWPSKQLNLNRSPFQYHGWFGIEPNSIPCLQYRHPNGALEHFTQYKHS